MPIVSFFQRLTCLFLFTGRSYKHIVTYGRPIRVLRRIYCLGEKSRVAKGHELPRGSGAMLPRKFFEMNMH